MNSLVGQRLEAPGGGHLSIFVNVLQWLPKGEIDMLVHFPPVQGRRDASRRG